jgi:predicted RNase H-like HicB family nuclease
MNEIIFMAQEPPEGGFAAEALGYPIFTVGETLEELNEMVSDAVICHVEEENRPKIIRLHFVREEVIAV